MGTVRTCDSGLWTDDPWFQELTFQQKYVFLYAFLNSHISPVGTFSITLTTLAFETGLDKHTAEEIVRSLDPKLVYFPEHKIFWVRNFYRNQKLGGTYRIAAQNKLKKLPEDIQQIIIADYPELAEETVKQKVADAKPEDLSVKQGVDPIDTVSIGYPYPTVTPLREESESESESESEVSKDTQSPPNPLAGGKVCEVAWKVEDAWLMFRKKHDQRYVVTNYHIPTNLRQKLAEYAADVGIENFEKALDAYFASNADFLLECKHAAGMFVSRGVQDWLSLSDKPKTTKAADAYGEKPYIDPNTEFYDLIDPVPSDGGYEHRFNTRLEQHEWFTRGKWSPVHPRRAGVPYNDPTAKPEVRGGSPPPPELVAKHKERRKAMAIGLAGQL